MGKLNLGEYEGWHLDRFGENLASEDIKTRFRANLTLAQTEINSHQFVKDSIPLLNEMAANKMFALTAGAVGPDLTCVAPRESGIPARNPPA